MKHYLLIALFSLTANAGLVNTPPAPVNAQSSLADKQASTAAQIRQAALHGYTFLKSAATQSFNLAFHNPLGLTVQQVEDALGTDACASHMAYLGTYQLLNGALPGSFTLVEPCTMTCNQDGTLTATACH